MLAASFLCFLLAELAPGDALDHLRLDATLTPETLATLRAELQLDQPFFVRYLAWLAAVVRGDWGHSVAYHRPVGELLAERAPTTLLLVLFASLIAWALALPLALLVARRRGSWLERFTNPLVAVVEAVPAPVLALGFLAVTAAWGLLPSGAEASFEVASLVIPAMALALAMLPMIFRQAKTALREALDSAAVLAARARGLPKGRVLGIHALRLAGGPLVGLAALSLTGLVSGSLVVEVIFSLPGLGPLALDAVLSRDDYLAAGTVLVAAMWIQLVRLGADLALAWLDPRTVARRA